LLNEALTADIREEQVCRLSELLLGGTDRRCPTIVADEWTWLIDAANREGFAPLLRYELEKRGWLGSVPTEVARSLDRAYFSTAANNLVLLGELASLLDDLGGDEPAIVLKGADLALSVYPGFALRPMCDLDILLPRERIEESQRKLTELGYERMQPEIAPGHNQMMGHAVSLIGGPSRCVAVELHWRLVGGDHDWRAPEADWFFEQTETWVRGEPRGSTEAAGSEVESKLPRAFTRLKPSAHLLYLSAHLTFQHGGVGHRLIWNYDLHLLVERYRDQLEWDEIRARAREFGWSASVVLALRETQKRFQTPLPDGFLDAVASDRDERSIRLLERESQWIRIRGESVWDELLRLSWRARLRFVWNHFFPSKIYMRWRYRPSPSWLWPLCYPYRWAVIVTEGLAALGKRFGSSRARAGSL
jgi:hypothetical protein